MRIIQGPNKEEISTKDTDIPESNLNRFECPSPEDPLNLVQENLLILVEDFKNKIRQRTSISEHNFNEMELYHGEIVDTMVYFHCSEMEIKAMDKLLNMMLIANFNLENYIPLPRTAMDRKDLKKLIGEIRRFAALVINKFCLEGNMDINKELPQVKILYSPGSQKEKAAWELVQNIIMLSQCGINNGIRLMVSYFRDIYEDLSPQKKSDSINYGFDPEEAG